MNEIYRRKQREREGRASSLKIGGRMTHPNRRRLQLVIPRPVVVPGNTTDDGLDVMKPGSKDPGVSGHEEPDMNGGNDSFTNDSETFANDELDGRPVNAIYSGGGSSSVSPTTFGNATMVPGDHDSNSSSTTPDPTEDLSNDDDDDGNDTPSPTANSEDRGFTPFPTESPTTFEDSAPLTMPPYHPPANAPTTHSFPRPSRPSSQNQDRTPFPPPHHPTTPTQKEHQKQPSSSSSSSSSCSQSDSFTIRMICSHPMGVLLVLVFGILLCIWRCRAQKRREDTTRGEYRAVAAHITDNAFDNTFADDYSYNDDDDNVADDEYDSEEDEFGWSGGKRHDIEMKKIGRR